jgi:hypothetical protein
MPAHRKLTDRFKDLELIIDPANIGGSIPYILYLDNTIDPTHFAMLAGSVIAYDKFIDQLNAGVLPGNTDTKNALTPSQQNLYYQLANMTSISGTTFPTSPKLGQPFYRIDRQVQYYWNSFNWVSDRLSTSLVPKLAQPIAQGTISLDGTFPYADINGFILENFVVNITAAIAHSATNFYSLSGVAYNNIARTTTNITFLGSTPKDTKLFTVAGRNEVLRPTGGGTFGAGYSGFSLYLVPTGNPGAINIHAGVGYRLIG